MGKLAAKLAAVRNSFAQNRTAKLRALANKHIREAALQNDKCLAAISLIAYSLHKLASKEHFAKSRKWNAVKADILFHLDRMVKSLKMDRPEKFDMDLLELIGGVEGIDRETGNFVTGIFEKARIKNASTAYSLGLSLGQSASLVGANKKDLLNYIGVTRMHDREGMTIGIGDRLKKLKAMLGE